MGESNNMTTKKRTKGQSCQWCNALKCNHCRCGGDPNWSCNTHELGHQCPNNKYRSRLICNACLRSQLIGTNKIPRSSMHKKDGIPRRRSINNKRSRSSSNNNNHESGRIALFNRKTRNKDNAVIDTTSYHQSQLQQSFKSNNYSYTLSPMPSYQQVIVAGNNRGFQSSLRSAGTPSGSGAPHQLYHHYYRKTLPSVMHLKAYTGYNVNNLNQHTYDNPGYFLYQRPVQSMMFPSNLFTTHTAIRAENKIIGNPVKAKERICHWCKDVINIPNDAVDPFHSELLQNAHESSCAMKLYRTTSSVNSTDKSVRPQTKEMDCGGK